MVEWPSLSICKTPFYRDELKYQEFMSKIQNNSFETEEELSKFMTAELQNVTNIADIYFENLR